MSTEPRDSGHLRPDDMLAADNPFCRRADPRIYGERELYLCAVTVEDRRAALRDMDAPTLRRALGVPWLQKSIRGLIERRLRVLDQAAGPAESDTARITDAIARSMGTRWCSSCQSHQPADAGTWVLNKRGVRQLWRCSGCVARRRSGAAR